METKFIEGTNEQYSIREDGVVIKNYNILRNGKKVYVESLIKGHFKKGSKNYGPNSKVFRIKEKVYSRGQLMINHYGYKSCNTDDCKNHVKLLNDHYCNCCKIMNRKISENKCLLKYREKYNLHKKRTMKLHVESLSKLYISNTLNISIFELSDELYEHQKNLIQFKRKICEENNININALK
jgi:hypothetical protein